jgi:hypothetical protein
MIGGENIHIYRQIRDEGREQEDHDGNACLIGSFAVEPVYARDSPDDLTPSPKHCLELERLGSSKYDDLDLITRFLAA